MAQSPQHQQPTTRLIWHRRDLRLTDNALYSDLLNGGGSASVISLYVLDPAFFTPRPSITCPDQWDTVWTGPYAWSLLIHALIDLRQSLQNAGSDLIVRVGDPTSIVPELALQLGANQVWWHQEPGTYELKVSDCIRKELETLGISYRTFVGCTLYHPDDLPRSRHDWARYAQPKRQYKQKSRDSDNERTDESLQHVDVSCQRWKGMPNVMGNFRTAARTFASIRPASAPPTQLQLPSEMKGVEMGSISTMEELCEPLLLCKHSILGLNSHEIELMCKSALAQHETEARGCESWALQRLHYFLDSGHAASARRNMADVVSGDDSSKLSVALAIGSISPRTVYEAVVNHANDNDESWLASHLEMRDFFLYTAFAAGTKLYQQEGMPVRPTDNNVAWRDPAIDETNQKVWRQWLTGTTNLPLVDAAMRELLATGYCSNRVRQNVASVLTKDLRIDWRAGAELFQFLLEDHCVAANWGNWMYFAGVGSDPKHRHFRTVSQALRYDPMGEYVTKWIPRLAGCSNLDAKFRPWDFFDDWGEPIVDPSTQLTWRDAQRLSDTGHLCEKLLNPNGERS